MQYQKPLSFEQVIECEKHEMTGAKRRRELQKKGIMEYFSFPWQNPP